MQRITRCHYKQTVSKTLFLSYYNNNNNNTTEIHYRRHADSAKTLFEFGFFGLNFASPSNVDKSFCLFPSVKETYLEATFLYFHIERARKKGMLVWLWKTMRLQLDCAKLVQNTTYYIVRLYYNWSQCQSGYTLLLY